MYNLGHSLVVYARRVVYFIAPKYIMPGIQRSRTIWLYRCSAVVTGTSCCDVFFWLVVSASHRKLLLLLPLVVVVRWYGGDYIVYPLFPFVRDGELEEEGEGLVTKHV